ncbi:hypothetical protein [Kitasatospora purpeofusca]|uniref:hypothetical protein n=1 Tax=Kitasatospora purpeofusca TaxID=67352 RepID=UPI0036D2603B
MGDLRRRLCAANHSRVAAAVRQRFNGGALLPTSGAEDTAPSEGPLPAPIAVALEDGDVTADLAGRLAAYWPPA